MTSTVRQIYSNSVAVVLGGFLCYFSGSKFDEFKCFFGRFLINMVVSYYIMYEAYINFFLLFPTFQIDCENFYRFSYVDFQRYIRIRTSLMAVEDAKVSIPLIVTKFYLSVSANASAVHKICYFNLLKYLCCM